MIKWIITQNIIKIDRVRQFSQTLHYIIYWKALSGLREVLRLRRYERILTGSRHFKGVGQFGPKFMVEDDIQQPAYLLLVASSSETVHPLTV